MRAIDCMGFAGGFTTGMVQSGFELVGKREMHGSFGVKNCDVNRAILGNDWEAEILPKDPSINDEVTWWAASEAEVVFGNPPCSGFSVMSNKDWRGANSPINECMRRFVRFAARVQPQIAVFESVQLARTRDDGLELMRQLRTLLEELTNDSWVLYHVRHNARYVGGCAERRRYFWVASRIPFGVDPATLTQGDVTLNDAIGDLDNLSLSWDAIPYMSLPTKWSDDKRSQTTYVDGHMTHDTPLSRRCVDLAHGVPWHPDEHLAIVARRYYEKYGKLPNSWAATQERVIKRDFHLGFTTPTRWNGDRPARVITGGSMCCAFHPRLDRMITHREAARIMGFPDDWKIKPLQNLPGLNMTWGKGITVQCGKWIGDAIMRALNGESDKYTGVSIGEREFDINFTDGIIGVTRGKVTRVAVNRQSRSGDQMSDTEVADTTEPTSAGGRGRPRPEETKIRDAKVLEWMKANSADGSTRNEIAEGTEIDAGSAYLSLYRLRRDGSVFRKHQNGAHRWFITSEEMPDESVGSDAVAS